MCLQARHCYCQLLERLVNVWAYHSGRRMLYLNPKTGALEEQHLLAKREGQGRRMWGWMFEKALLEEMSEDRAEVWDDTDGWVNRTGRWLWPHTGTVTWEGSRERERTMKSQYRLEKGKRRERLALRRKTYNQKTLDGGSKKGKPKKGTRNVI